MRKEITIREAIEFLSKYPDDAVIVLSGDWQESMFFDKGKLDKLYCTCKKH